VLALTAALTAGLMADQRIFAVGALLGAGIVPLALWNVLVIRETDVSLGGAAGIGALAVIVAYPVMLSVGLVLAYLFGAAPPEQPAATLSDIFHLVLFASSFGAYLGFLLTGWVTVPIGIAVAVAVAWWTRRQARAVRAAEAGA
jgi:hypothetical protein